MRSSLDVGRRARVYTTWLLAFSMFLIATAAGAQNRILTVLARDGDTIDGHVIDAIASSAFSLNNNGLVAFPADFGGERGIFTQNALLARTGVNIGGKILTGIGSFSIGLNDNDVVAFRGTFDSGHGLFTPSQLLVAAGDSVGGKLVTSIGGGDIDFNDSEEVVFFGVFDGGQGVFTSANRFVAGSGDTIGGFTLKAPSNFVEINDAGLVVFVAQLDLPFVPRGVFTESGVVAAPGDEVDMRMLSSASAPWLNNNGDVSYFAIETVAAQGVVLRDATGEQRIVAESFDVIDGVTISSPQLSSINDDGEIVFLAFIHGAGFQLGIFTENELIARAGDVIDGKIVSFVSQPQINNRRDIAFVATFTDGSRSVLMSSPDSDGDGITDGDDECVTSDLGPTVMTDSCDTGVENDLFANGCSLSDIIDEVVSRCSADARNHGSFVSCVSQETNELKQDGILSGGDKGAVQACVG